LVTIPEDNYEDIDYVMIPEGMVKTRVEKLARDIFYDYCGKRDKPIRIFVIMNGAFQFFTDLLSYFKKMAQYKKEKLYFETDFIKIKGYVNTETKLEEIDEGCITESMVKDQDIIIVEDIFDSGTLMSKLLTHINKFNPKSVEAVILLHKENPANLKHNFVSKYTGFSCPGDKFVIGYGMDYNETFRELPHVCIITESAIKKYKIEI
jgi:hypoxanthine phosphoribosyltransferase